MNNTFQEKRNTYLLLVGLLFVLLIILYIAFLNPLRGELKDKKASVEAVQANVERLEEVIKQSADEDGHLKQRAALQQKVPPSHQVDEFVLMLQQLEQESSSTVESIDFQYDVGGVAEDVIPELDVNEETLQVEKSNENEGEPSESQQERLKKLAINITVFSPTYEDFLSVLTAIESQERIISIDGLYVNKADPDEVLYDVELIAFYYEE